MLAGVSFSSQRENRFVNGEYWVLYEDGCLANNFLRSFSIACNYKFEIVFIYE